VLLCTGFLSYSGPFNQEFRDKLITLWQKEMCERKIPYSQDLNLISMLVDTTTVRYILLHGIFCFACDYGNSFSFTLLPCACPHHNLYCLIDDILNSHSIYYQVCPILFE
jgi:dynein heavy chain